MGDLRFICVIRAIAWPNLIPAVEMLVTTLSVWQIQKWRNNLGGFTFDCGTNFTVFVSQSLTSPAVIIFKAALPETDSKNF